MKCPKCGCLDDKVLESRQNKDATAIRRRRECLECGFRFTSYENIEKRPIKVIKKDGQIQNFDITKIERGIDSCTAKLSIGEDVRNELIETIEERINTIAGPGRRVTTIEIGEEVLKALYPISFVAYVRFAAVYREFSDVNQFIEEINKLSEKR
jgi:transcriptional regulator NrdR